MSYLIEKYEGFSQIAYRCPAGVWTIGYGSTCWEDGTPIKQGDTITRERARELMNKYLMNIFRELSIIPDLKADQLDALSSLIYNIGWPAFKKSKCWKAIKNKDWETAFKNWDWIKAGGKVLPGLIKRRAEEMYLFFKDI